MATFDQLPADQRAIVELVLKRGRSYSQLSDMLGMDEPRVRELAREALTHLAPVTAKRVDGDWRSQIADYALGQQSGPESAATEGHLARSEAARAWLGSLIDSLDDLFGDANRPELPAADGSRPRARDRRGGASTAAATLADDATAERERPARAGRRESAEPAPTPSPLTGGRAGGPLSPAARAVVMRRRIIGGVLALALVAAAIVLLVSNGGSDKGKKADKGKAPATAAADTAAANNGGIVGEIALKPVDPKDKTSVGIAQIATSGKDTQLGVRAQLPKVTGRKAYEVWLYNSRTDAVSLGAQQPDAKGLFTGAAKLPAGFQKYKFIDVSLEPINRDGVHSGHSVIRGAFTDLVTPQQAQQQQQQGGAATPTTPAP
ncbi:MAG: hypothetical protein QOJ07_215 [Thermoleophilaceae bacterium]|nr:hypothetical protein [Thermoleophilaceae bacterium]